MAKGKKIFFITSLLVVISYMIFGLFFPELPAMVPDENWEVSRMHNLIKFHRLDEPLFTKDVSPFLAEYYNATPANQLLNIVKNGVMTVAYLLLPLNENQAIRFSSFCWSFLLCVFTYMMARNFGINKFASFFSSVLLIISPEFFVQVHTERVEVALTVSFIIFVLLLNRSLKQTDEKRKRWWLVLTGLFSWVPAITIHPSGLFIPPTLGIIYLVINRKKIFNINTVLLGVSFLPGFILLAYCLFSIANKAIAMGGGNYFDMQGAPIMVRGVKYFILLPVIFYQKFAAFNIFSKPVSLLWFMAAAYGLFFLFRAKNYLVKSYSIILSAVITCLFLCYFFSGSYGNYNIFVFPFLAIALSCFINYFTEKNSSSAVTKSLSISLGVILLFSSNFYGMTTQMNYVKEYNKLQSEVRKEIPENIPVVGSVLYYTTFKNQPFYHLTWMESTAGVNGQTFEQAVTVLKTKYLIVDDLFLGRAVGAKRDSSWMKGMENFLENKCSLQKCFQTNYYVGAGSRVPNSKLYPAFWRYEGMKTGILQKVCIYKVNS